jgi:ABC-type transport system involved in multi-copper enzyme maturation permease subunit
LDLLLARPMSRWKLILFKYVGGIWFIFLIAAVLIAGCWLGLGLRTGFYNPWFLACTLTVAATFAVVYSVSVLFGVLTRSTVVSALLAVGVWWLSALMVNARHSVKTVFRGQDIPRGIEVTLEGIYTVLPKTPDLGHLNTLFLARSHLSEAAYQRIIGPIMPDVRWGFSLGSTALFVAVMLGLSIWIFHRRDH